MALVNSRDVVMGCVQALNAEDFEAARDFVSDDMSFVGVMGSRSGAEAYFDDMKRLRLKYDIKKTFADGPDVCLLYDLTMAGKTLFSCGWYQVQHGKIVSLRVVFDPRPILDGSR
jgi:SnoaL-like domain